MRGSRRGRRGLLFLVGGGGSVVVVVVGFAGLVIGRKRGNGPLPVPGLVRPRALFDGLEARDRGFDVRDFVRPHVARPGPRAAAMRSVFLRRAQRELPRDPPHAGLVELVGVLRDGGDLRQALASQNLLPSGLLLAAR
mmetsp:Transcript_12424/g.40677  ORF Transcript_12424/g.40677 Transcript_12424/m.40677 type:complete len:138 (-) Transcript_12424:370-783(-)